MHRTRIALAAATLAFAATAPALAGGPTVRVADNAFRAKTVHVAVGGTVTWRWAGKVGHNVTFKTLHSPTQTRGTFRHRFTRRGTYHYVCTIHRSSGMTGTVVVG